MSSSGLRLATDRRTFTIVVVDDEILIRLAAADFLREEGFRVVEASNAMEVRSVFEFGQPVHALFTDVLMPGMSGIDLSFWVRSRYPDVAILLTSGISDIHNDCSYRGEFGEPLPKPYSFDGLLSALISRLEKGNPHVQRG